MYKCAKGVVCQCAVSAQVCLEGVVSAWASVCAHTYGSPSDRLALRPLSHHTGCLSLTTAPLNLGVYGAGLSTVLSPHVLLFWPFSLEFLILED